MKLIIIFIIIGNIIPKAPIQSGMKHLCASRAQNDALDATLSHSAQAQL